MLLELNKLSPSSRIEVDKIGLSVIVDACQLLLSKGPATIDELWDGDIADLARLASEAAPVTPYSNLALFQLVVRQGRLRGHSSLLPATEASIRRSYTTPEDA